jgi:hypothetical protein
MVRTNPIKAQSNSEGASTDDVFTRWQQGRIQTFRVTGFASLGTGRGKNFLEGRRWGDGEMGRWGDGEMGRWGDGGVSAYAGTATELGM